MKSFTRDAPRADEELEMLIVGVTGSFGTGKSTVTAMFAKRGAAVLDADRIAHQILEPGQPGFKPVVRQLGNGILKEGRIDRKKVADLVFRHPGKLKTLTDIIHPLVIKEIKKQIRKYRNRNKSFVVLDVPLLIEAGLQPLTDVLIVVRANRTLQIQRTCKRIGISRSEALRRIKRQMPINEKIRQADIIVDNRGNLNQTRKQVEAICQKLTKIKATR